MNHHHDVLTTNQAFYQAFEQKDLQAMSQVWSHGTGCLCIHPGRDVLRGWEAVRNSWEAIFRNTSYFEIETKVIAVDVSGLLAYVVLQETVFQVVRGESFKAQSVATNVFEQMAQKWYLIHHHGSGFGR